MTNKERKELAARWEAQRAIIQSGQRARSLKESAEAKAQRVAKARSDYAYFVSEYFPHYAKSPTPSFHLKLANRILAEPQLKAIVEWYRGAAKSVLTDILLPLWLLIQTECQLKCMALIGVNETAAIRLLNDIKIELEVNENLQDDFNIGKKHGDWADKEFTASNGSMFVALGLGQSVRGLRKSANRPDYVVIDDIDDLPLSRNPKRLAQHVNWINRSVLGVFDEGRSRFFIVNNRIAKDQVMSRMVKLKPHWHHSFVPALRKNGKPSWPEKHSVTYWKTKRLDVGEASWLTEYMLEPVTEGERFKDAWIKWYKLKKTDIERVVVYIDPSWRNTTTSDHKAVKVWAKKTDGDKHLMKAFVRKCETDEMVDWCFEWYKKNFAHLPVSPEFYIEGVFMQDDFMQEFNRQGRERKFHLPIMPDFRSKPQKESRIASMIPQYSRGFVTYEATEENDPDMKLAIDHLLGWDIGSNMPDDSPDADESAWHILDHMASFSSGASANISIGFKSQSPHRL